MSASVGPASIAAIGPVTTGSLLWRGAGQLHLTIIVKAALALEHERPMPLLAPPAIAVRDAHHGGDPTRSLATASDLVPYRARADVWLTGHAHAPGAEQVSALVARLALYRGRQAILDKVVHVQGDRSAQGATEPFTRMPLVYERAFGGAGFDDNPVGVGADERGAPNLVDPRDPKRAVGFGPISRYWKQRRKLVSGELRRELDKAVPDLPADFDWSYYQCAPVDQRIDYLEGDEWVVIDGLHPGFVRLQSRLPKLKPVARMLSVRAGGGERFGGTPRETVLSLRADTLVIDTDTHRCEVTWRAMVRLGSEEALGALLFAAGLKAEAERIGWDKVWEQAAATGGAGASVTASTVPRIRLDRSGVTDVSPQPSWSARPGDPLAETRARPRVHSDPLLETTVDPPRGQDWVGEDTQTQTHVHPQVIEDWRRASGKHARVSESDPSTEPDRRFPRAPSDREVTATLPSALADATAGREAVYEDTEPTIRDQRPRHEGEPTGEAGGWSRQPAPPSQPSPPSLPPEPLDVDALVDSLREAGASAEDIARVLATIERGRRGR
jgi:hypothetical protein